LRNIFIQSRDFSSLQNLPTFKTKTTTKKESIARQECFFGKHIGKEEKNQEALHTHS